MPIEYLREILPPQLLAAIDAAELATRENDRMIVTLAVGYGGREEIADAVRSLMTSCSLQGLSLAEAAMRVSPEAIRQHLYLSAMPDPDRERVRAGSGRRRPNRTRLMAPPISA